MSQNLLIMFIKNSLPGKVKLRLAEEIGPDKALDVYIRMLEHIRRVTGKLPFDKAVWQFAEHGGYAKDKANDRGSREGVVEQFNVADGGEAMENYSL